MEIFPFILCRVAGLPLQYLEDLQWPNAAQWQGLLAQENQIQIQKQKLLDQLSPIIGDHPDYKTKNTLANLYKDLLQDRRLRPEKFQSALQYSAIAQDFFEALTTFQTQKQTLAKARENWEENYPGKLNQIRLRLQELLKAKTLQLGLPFSSLSTYRRLQNYLTKAPSDFRKKEWQTERTALQFLTRAMSKTSPFSTYTTLSLQSLSNPDFKIKASSKVRLNNYLLAYAQAVLEGIPDFYRQLDLKINPSLRKQESRYTFLLNSRNVEALQEVERNPLLEALILLLNAKPMTFGELVKKACDFVDAEVEALEAFVLELVEYGLLEWDWPLSGRDPQWVDQLLKMIRLKRDFPLKEGLLQLLLKVAGQSQELAEAEAEKRVRLLSEMTQELKSFFESHLKSDAETEEESDTFRRITASEFTFKAEKIAYEDVSFTHQALLSKKAIAPILKELDTLVQGLNPLFIPTWKETTIRHFDTYFAAAKSVDLLTFYDSFFRRENFDEAREDLAKELLPALLGKLQAGHYFDEENGICQLSIADLKTLLPPIDSEKVANIQGPAHAGMFHFFRNEKGTLSAFVEANILGNGKMMGRFLHLFPKEITEAIRTWNSEMQGKEKWIENVDASYFNANLYPSLLPCEIAAPGSQNLLPQKQQVALSELDITKENGQLILRQKQNGTRVKIYNFGLEALDNRSSMYRLLQTFSYQVPVTEVLTHIVDAAFVQKMASGLLILPRLLLGKHLVLKRKRWFFPKTLLPELANGAANEARFFLAVQRWREQWQLPAKVFIRIQPQQIPGMERKVDENESRKSDDYKPQYFDFNQPLLVQLFGRLLRRVTDYLEVEEMLPAPEEALDMEGEARALEILVEWKR